MAHPASPTRLHLDANAILRYLRNDLPEQANAVESRLLQAQSGRLILEIHPLILTEVIYVLQSHYGESRRKIAVGLLVFLNTPGIRLQESDRFRKALSRYADNNVSFVDAFLATLGAETSHPIFSFDRGLDKFKDIRRVQV